LRRLSGVSLRTKIALAVVAVVVLVAWLLIWQKLQTRGSLLTAMTFATPQSGWAVGAWGAIWHTDDGGHTWTQQNWVRHSTDEAHEILYDVRFVSPQLGWAVGGYGTLLTSQDGGQRWAVSKFPGWDFRSLFFATPQSGWIVEHQPYGRRRPNVAGPNERY